MKNIKLLIWLQQQKNGAQKERQRMRILKHESNENSKSRYSIKRIYYYDVNIKLGFEIMII